MKTEHFTISHVIARDKNIPCSFVAKVLVETAKAVYVYGHGEEEQKVDTWLPKATIKTRSDSAVEITVPADHPMTKPRQTSGKRASLIQYRDTGKPAIKITFPFNRDDLEHVKTLPGRFFHGDGYPKYWTCPLTTLAVQSLEAWEFDIDENLRDFIHKKEEKKKTVITEIPGLQKPLYPFQQEGVSFIERRNGKAIIGSEMGLGKTAQALAWLQLHPEKRPVIAVVPASLKLNWQREAEMWMEKPSVQILSGTKAKEPIVGDIIIINYDILPAWLGVLQGIRAQVLILDEVHAVKNNAAKRTKAVKALARGIPHILALSGTPIVNRPVEFYNALKLVDDEGVFPSFWKFAMRYCGAKHNGFGWDFNGASNTEELYEKARKVMIRHSKKDVLTDLPDKTRSFLPLELSNSKEYRKAENDFIRWVRETKGEDAARRVQSAEVMVKIEALKQLAVKGKLEQAIEWIRDFIEVDGKLVIFATHKFVIDALMGMFEDVAVKVDGSVTGADRDKAVERFQNDESCRVFVGNIKAAGVGITLTAASNVAFLELPWSPGDLVQAEDRCHRIGQKNAVNIHYLLAAGTIEETIAQVLDKKRRVLDAVLDGKETESESLLAELINTYEEEKNG